MTEQNKASAPSQEHPYPQPVVQYQQPYNAAYPPPPPGTAPYPYFYPPPAEANHGENGQNGMPPGPYMMLAPPGHMVYVHPTQPQGPSASAQPAHSRPKRKQVKMACTNCAAACKRCDESRPCERCQKYGIADSCVDGQRKERKKGIKRGPYKRKNKGGSDSPGYSGGGGGGEWAPGSQPSPSASTTAAAIHAVTAQLNPEGYYPPTTIFYPPPYMSHPPDGQPGPDGSPSHINGQPPMMPYYIHPGAYPPYGHYPAMYPHPPPPHLGAPPPGAPTLVPGTDQPQTVNPADTSKKDDVGEAPGAETAVNAKKRSRASRNGEPKSKRAKPSSTLRKDRDADLGEDGNEDGGDIMS